MRHLKTVHLGMPRDGSTLDLNTRFGSKRFHLAVSRCLLITLKYKRNLSHGGNEKLVLSSGLAAPKKVLMTVTMIERRNEPQSVAEYNRAFSSFLSCALQFADEFTFATQ